MSPEVHSFAFAHSSWLWILTMCLYGQQPTVEKVKRNEESLFAGRKIDKWFGSFT